MSQPTFVAKIERITPIPDAPELYQTNLGPLGLIRATEVTESLSLAVTGKARWRYLILLRGPMQTRRGADSRRDQGVRALVDPFAEEVPFALTAILRGKAALRTELANRLDSADSYDPSED